MLHHSPKPFKLSVLVMTMRYLYPCISSIVGMDCMVPGPACLQGPVVSRDISSIRVKTACLVLFAGYKMHKVAGAITMACMCAQAIRPPSVVANPVSGPHPTPVFS